MNIHIPTPLRVYSDKQDTVTVDAATVGQALDALTAKHPELKKHLYSDEGKLRSFVNVYLNDEDIRYLPEKEATKVSDKDALSIIPSIAGGCWPHGTRAARHANTELAGTGRPGATAGSSIAMLNSRSGNE
jgi:molybdopterin synthase sulfur carrier subunit